MKFKHPGDAMRALMIHGHVHCGECTHFQNAGVPWCRKHTAYPSERPAHEIVRQGDHLYCADYEFFDQK